MTEDVVIAVNQIVLRNVSTQELLDEVARRYNLNPEQCQEALSSFMYAYVAMEQAKYDETHGNSEDGNHGNAPF